MKLLIPSILALALAACGGGGGSGSSGGAVAPPPVVQTAKIQQVSVQRAVATQTLSSTQATKEAYSFGASGNSTFSTVRRVMNSASGRITASYKPGMRVASSSPVRVASVAYGPCTNSTETYTNNVSSTEVQLYARAFYDTGCTKLYQDIYLDLIAVSSTTVNANGTIAQSNLAGTVFAYNTLVISLSQVSSNSATFSLYITDAVNQTSPQLAAVGVACSVIGTTSLACGAGAVAHSATLSADGGATMNVSATIVSAGTVAVNASGSAFSGGLNSLSLNPGSPFPAWAIAGGTLVDSASIGGQLTFNTLGFITAGTLTVTDAADDGTAVLTANSSGISGIIKQTSTGITVATFSVDSNGNGTITYSSGTVAQITDWQVIG